MTAGVPQGAEVVSARMEQLNPFAREKGAPPHLFARQMARGARAMPGLLAIAEHSRAKEERRLAALDALGVLAAKHGLKPGFGDRLAAVAVAGDFRYRQAATQVLALGQDPDFLAQLRAALPEVLRRRDVAAAVGAIRGLALARDTASGEMLVHVMQDADHISVREAAVEALGRMGYAPALPLLHELFLQRESLVVVLGALARLGTRETLGLVPQTLRSPYSLERHATAATLAALLGRWGDCRETQLAIPEIYGALCEEQEPKIGWMLLLCARRAGAPVPPDLFAHALGLQMTIKEPNQQQAAGR